MWYPAMREELRSALESLSDRSYQLAAWVNKVFPPGVVYDEFSNPVHFFYDDTRLSTDASSAIGVFLFDEREASAVREVVSALDRVLDRYGTTLKDAEYISKPEWDSVLQAAKMALSVISEKQAL
jgi:hypothetical protein